MTTVSTVKNVPAAAKIIAKYWGFKNCSIKSDTGVRPIVARARGRGCAMTDQNFKLIIFFMTSTPIPIQIPATTSRKLPIEVRNKMPM